MSTRTKSDFILHLVSGLPQSPWHFFFKARLKAYYTVIHKTWQYTLVYDHNSGKLVWFL